MTAETLVSIRELALRLKVTPSCLTEVAVSAGILSAPPSAAHLPLERVPGLLETFRTVHARTHIGWDIPPWLAASEDPVLRVIAEHYREPMTRPASLSPSQGLQLRELVLASAPRRVVEIGSFLGMSSLWMASALRELGGGMIEAVDPFEPRLPFAATHCGCVVDPQAFIVAALQRAGVAAHVSLQAMRSRRYAQILRARATQDIDFLFIDGDHSVGGCLDDFVSYYPYVRCGGHILLHDIHPARCGWRGPRYLIDHFLTDTTRFAVSEIVTEPDYGMALITKLTDDTVLAAVPRLRASVIKSVHRSVQGLIHHKFVRRLLKPLVTARQLRRAGLI